MNKLEKSNKIRLGFEFALNIATILMGIAATIWGFIDVKGDPWFCKWFTNLSNWLMILGFIVYLIFLVVKTTGKIKRIPQGIIIFQLAGIVAAAITLFGILFYLWPVHGGNPFAKYNVFFHLLLPLFGMLTFLLTEHAPHVQFKYLWLCILPMDAYLIFYFIMYMKNPSSGDWYGIIRLLKEYSPLAFVGMAAFQFLIGWLLWLGNRYIHFGQPKPDPYFKWHKK